MLSTRIVRLLGALAILMAVAYFIAVFFAFKAGIDDPFGQHFMRLGILYVYGPVFTLALYFYARVNLGRRLLERDGQLSEQDQLSISLHPMLRRQYLELLPSLPTTGQLHILDASAPLEELLNQQLTLLSKNNHDALT